MPSVNRFIGVLALTILPTLGVLFALVLLSSTARTASAQDILRGPMRISLPESVQLTSKAAPEATDGRSAALSISGSTLKDSGSWQWIIRREYITPEIQSLAGLSPNSRQVTIAGVIACDAGEKVRLRAEVTQGTTGALAKGHIQESCTGAVQHWTIKAVAHGPDAFAAGAASVRVWANTEFHGQVTDSFQWERPVTLE